MAFPSGTSDYICAVYALCTSTLGTGERPTFAIALRMNLCGARLKSSVYRLICVSSLRPEIWSTERTRDGGLTELPLIRSLVGAVDHHVKLIRRQGLCRMAHHHFDQDPSPMDYHILAGAKLSKFRSEMNFCSSWPIFCVWWQHVEVAVLRSIRSIRCGCSPSIHPAFGSLSLCGSSSDWNAHHTLALINVWLALRPSNRQLSFLYGWDKPDRISEREEPQDDAVMGVVHTGHLLAKTEKTFPLLEQRCILVDSTWLWRRVSTGTCLTILV